MNANVIGVDVGGTKILAGVVGSDGAIRARREHPTPLGSEEALLSGLQSAVGELLDDSVVAVGFGIPSRIDQRTGTAIGSVNIPLVGVPFRDVMSKRLGLPVAIDNDGNAAAIAEWRFGAGRGTADLIMLTLGTGVGAGLILGGRPYRGSIGAGAEIGHVVIVHDGVRCSCGGYGHLESYVSGKAADEVARGRASDVEACDLAETLRAKAILVPTATGRTASAVARLRPRRPIIALTHNRYAVQQMALEWGVIPLLVSEAQDVEDLWELSIGAARSLVSLSRTVSSSRPCASVASARKATTVER